MKKKSRLVVEALENRWCPALTATLNTGVLTVSGTADNGSIAIVQDSSTAGKISVSDGAVAVSGSPFSGVNTIRLVLTAADDHVRVNLGGQKLAGNIFAHLGDGANDLKVKNGAIGGALSVSAGLGDDSVTLGDGTTALTIKDVSLGLDGGIDTVNVNSGVTVTRFFSTTYANNVTLAAGSTTDYVFIRGGSAGNTINLNGDVTGSVSIDSYFCFGSSAGTTVNINGEVDGNVGFLGSNMPDTFNVAGNIGKSVYAATLGGNDSISITGAVTANLVLDAGSGDDVMSLNNVVGGQAFVFGGAGNDSLTIGASAHFLSTAVVSMGAGNDSVTLNDSAQFTTLLINGGTGTDTFNGNPNRPGLTLISFP
jgi:fibronectin-binding autotransporter adhesin